MSVISYLLLISPLKVLNCLHRVLNSHSFENVTGSNQLLYPLCHVSSEILTGIWLDTGDNVFPFISFGCLCTRECTHEYNEYKYCLYVWNFVSLNHTSGHYYILGGKKTKEIKRIYTDICACVLSIMVIIIGNGPDDPSSNPGQDCLFYFILMPLWKA